MLVTSNTPSKSDLKKCFLLNLHPQNSSSEVVESCIALGYMLYIILQNWSASTRKKKKKEKENKQL